MRKTFVFLIVVLLFCGTLGVANALLVDFGENSEMFYDTISKKYFYDPIEFIGQSRTEVDAWLDSHSAWRYADGGEISQLLRNNLPIGDPAGTDWLIMGQPTSATSYLTVSGSTRYLFNWGGWNERTLLDPTFFPHWSYTDFGEITMGYNIPTAGLDEIYYAEMPGFDLGQQHVGGAWLVTDHNPVPEPTTMLLLGSSLFGLAVFGRKKLFKK